MEKALVSVIIPAYNSGSRLDRSVGSVTAQTWDELEIFIVDDGSTDDTFEQAQAWAERDPRVRVIHQKNAGVSAARNAALAKCTGRYVRFVDSDDEMPRGSVERMVERMERDGSDMALAYYEEVVIGGRTHLRFLTRRNDTVSWREYLDFLDPHSNSFSCGVLWNKLFRRELIEAQNVRFVSGLKYGEDFVFVCDYLGAAAGVSFMDSVEYRYIRRLGSLTFGQAADCLIHPVQNIRTKLRLYGALKELYVKRNVYGGHKRTLWRFLFRVTLTK